MSTPKIGCLCVSGGRVPVIPISLWSYQHQTYSNKMLLIFSHVSRQDLLHTIDVGCDTLFGACKCDYVAIWDDDDYSPPDRLECAARSVGELDQSVPIVVSYSAGWFCNLETLLVDFIDVLTVGKHLWGGCMTFNRAAYDAFGRFVDHSCPGYDRELQNAVKVHDGFIAQQFGPALPVAFVHGKNMATMMHSKGERALDSASPEMPKDVRDAVRAAQAFLKERGVRVPAPEV